jgi:hypothetical protein
MFNLLLQKEKKSVYREYTLRLLSVIFLAFFAVMFIGAIFLLPSYVRLRLEERAHAAEILNIKKIDTDQELAVLLADAKIKISGLSTEKKISSKTVIENIVAARGNGIVLNGIEYVHEGKEIHIRVSGISERRENLVAFSKELERDPIFNTVDVPVSNFVKDRDIEFSFEIHSI